MNMTTALLANKLVEVAFGNEDGAPMDSKFKADMSACFYICIVADQEFAEKSVEFRLAIMSERIGQQTQREYIESHDLAMKYMISRNKWMDIIYMAKAERAVALLNLKDYKVVHMTNPHHGHYYHLYVNDEVIGENISVAFHLDWVKLDEPDDNWTGEFVSQMNKVIADLRHKYLYERHPDCKAKGCQYAYDHGAEGSCVGRCQYVNLS